MEEPNLMENRNIPQNRKHLSCKVVLYTSTFVLITISSLVSAVFCSLHYKQSPETCWAHGSLKRSVARKGNITMIWEWKFKHCKGLVQENQENEHLIIMENGNYFIYAQVNRRRNVNESFMLALYQESQLILNVTGPRGEKGTVNFGRPFQLQKGAKLRCGINFDPESIGNYTYWGLYRI